MSDVLRMPTDSEVDFQRRDSRKPEYLRLGMVVVDCCPGFVSLRFNDNDTFASQLLPLVFYDIANHTRYSILKNVF